MKNIVIYPKTKTRTNRKAIALLLALTTIVISSSLWLSATGLQATPSYVPIDSWSTSSALPVSIASLNAIEHNNHIYLIGGRTSNGSPTANVYRASISANGSLSTWSTTSALPKPLYLHSINATDTHVYAIGGWKGSAPVQKIVYRASFLPNGGLGAWVNTGQDYPSAIDLHGSVISGNRIYGFGGRDGFSALSTVHSAAINSDGSLSAWRAETQLPQSLYRHAVTEHNGYIYVTGGFNQNAKDLVYYSKVNPNGTLGAWQTGTNLPIPTYYHRTVIHDGRLVAIAGKNDSIESSAVYSASINGDGSIGNWRAEASLPKSLYRFGAVSVEKNGSEYIIVIGGFTGGGTQSSVYNSALPPTPTPTSTSTPTATPPPTPTPTPPASLSATLSNQPSHWIAVDEEITYTITYKNDGGQTVTSANISSIIPGNTELVAGQSMPPASNVTASSAGGEVSWTLGTLAPGDEGLISYKVKRIVPTPASEPPVPVPDAALNLKILGPTSAPSNAPITYTMVITNEATQLQNAKATVKLPLGSTYISHTGNAQLNGDTLEWDLQTLEDYTTESVSFVISASQTIIVKDYEAHAEVPGIPAPGNITQSREDEILITDINGSPPAGTGDDVIISNNNVKISWVYNGQSGNDVSINSVENPSTQVTIQNSYTFLPFLSR